MFIELQNSEFKSQKTYTETCEPFLVCSVSTANLSKNEEIGFNWSEVHLYLSNLLQNPYFREMPPGVNAANLQNV